MNPVSWAFNRQETKERGERMGAKYPAQSNLQTTWAMRDELDAVAQLSNASRAEIARECFEEALHAVMLRRRVGVARVRKLAAEIAAAREAKVEGDGLQVP